MWTVPRMWEDGEVWILGGGPSLPRQFGVPEEVIAEVRSGASPALYSPYMRALHARPCIAINVAFLIGDWVDMMFAGDRTFLLNYATQIAGWPGLRVSCAAPDTRMTWMKWLAKGPVHGISDHPGKVCWNGNSGAASISVAVNAGARRICLLGFDMSLDSSGAQHWHQIYARNASFNQRPKRLPFGRHLIGFDKIAADAKQRGVEILNVNTDSKITQFPIVSLNSVL